MSRISSSLLSASVSSSTPALADLADAMDVSADLPSPQTVREIFETRSQEHVAWLNEHVVTETLPTGNTLRGWRSNHLPPEGGPLGWATAQALRCIARIHTLSRELLVPATFQPTAAATPPSRRKNLAGTSPDTPHK